MHKADMEKATLRKWQDEVLRRIDIQSNRQILWVYDEEGNKGKTFLSKYLCVMKGAIRFQNGKSADIKYAYNGQDIVIFDYVRSMEEIVNYGIIECMKDGIMFSTKYESKQKYGHTNTKVVCFSNFKPAIDKMSLDRWDLLNIDNFNTMCKKKAKLNLEGYNKWAASVEVENGFPVMLD